VVKPRKVGELLSENGKNFLINPKKQSFEVEETTLFLWSACDGIKELPELISAFMVEYSIELSKRMEIERIVGAAINEMAEMGLLELV
jgi:hypothetical protein